MKVKTNLKAGETAQKILASAQKQVGAWLGSAQKVVANPKFWTWPF